MKRYAGIGTAALLILAALFLPRGWFMLRDAASLDNFHEESLAPLMVAELDSGYERRTFERIRNYMGTQAVGDVICSSKEIDAGNESLWEELDLAMTGELPTFLLDMGLVALGEKYGALLEIESCTQYVLIRESDGQILLVANDILLRKDSGAYAELLIDGVDGTVYYLRSEEYGDVHKEQARLMDSDILLWYWLANNAYGIQQEDSEIAYIDVEEVENVNLNMSGNKTELLINYEENAYSNAWIFEDESTLTLCYRLRFGQNLTSWSLELHDMEGQNLVCYQMGFPAIVSAIPEMAQRIELSQYEEFFE